jgi:predicted negative regulator of RcsB-dependent stress response
MVKALIIVVVLVGVLIELGFAWWDNRPNRRK